MDQGARPFLSGFRAAAATDGRAARCERMIRQSLAALLVLSTAAACASPVGLLTRGRLKGDEQGVTVFSTLSDGAWPLAVAHCSRFHKSASFARREGSHTVFRCVL
jgi:hypothetical protein